MAGQAPSRRQLLQALGCAAVASHATGFVAWSYAFAETGEQHSHHPAGKPARVSGPYRPRFFSTVDFATVAVLAELVLPRTSTPGALADQPSAAQQVGSSKHVALKPEDAGATDAGVAEFIDFMVSEDPSLQPIFRDGLHWMDHESTTPFRERTHAEQTSVLERVAYRKNFREGDKAGQDFFAVLRRYTVMGFYTSRIGLESLDFPGLRFYAESPSVAQDDPLRRLGV